MSEHSFLRARIINGVTPFACACPSKTYFDHVPADGTPGTCGECRQRIMPLSEEERYNRGLRVVAKNTVSESEEVTFFGRRALHTCACGLETQQPTGDGLCPGCQSVMRSTG
jgi:hypothetical protein